MRKWAWIAHELEKLGFDWLTQKADKIDEVLCDLYPDEEEPFSRDLRILFSYCVQELARYNTRASLTVIRHVALTSDFCVACRHAERLAVEEPGKDMCEVCLFASRAGRCDEDGSLFSDFIAELDKTIDWVDEPVPQERGE